MGMRQQLTWNVNNKEEDKVPFAEYSAMFGAVQTIKYLINYEKELNSCSTSLMVLTLQWDRAK
jgi:hypothetical protein